MTLEMWKDKNSFSQKKLCLPAVQNFENTQHNLISSVFPILHFPLGSTYNTDLDWEVKIPISDNTLLRLTKPNWVGRFDNTVFLLEVHISNKKCTKKHMKIIDQFFHPTIILASEKRAAARGSFKLTF